MVTQLGEMQFELLPHEEAASGFRFGIGLEASVDDEGFDTGSGDWITQDTQNSRRGVRNFGRDVPSADSWSWQSHVNREDIEGAVETLEAWKAAWRGPDVLEEEGALAVIRYHLAGRTRRAYGRPRGFSAPPSNRILSGYVPVDHHMDMVDAYTYDDIPSTATLTLNSSDSNGGFILPARMPIRTLPPASSGIQQINVNGTAKAYPVIRFHGPWTAPTLATDDWVLTVNTSIGVDQWIEVDTRPWRLTAVREDGTSVAGALGRRIWLEDIYFRPGTRPQLALDGSSLTGGASCEVVWRNAWNSI